MLERFGVHIMPFLGSGAGAGAITRQHKPFGVASGSMVNSSESQFYTTTIELPKEMALVLVLAQDSSVPVQQTNTSRGAGGMGLAVLSH